MKPNFHAIEAIVYGLKFGVTGIPTALKRGWLSILIGGGATLGVFGVIMSSSYPEAVQGGFGLGALFGDLAEQVRQVFDEIEVEEIEDLEAIFGDEATQNMAGTVLLLAAAQFLSAILFIPALVDLYRKATGQETRPGFLPGFGREEWSLFLSVVLFALVSLLFYALLAVPIFGLMAMGGAMENPLVIFVAGAFAAIAVAWFSVRIQLFPIHAALTGRVALIEAFGLTGGRFWKLLGTNLLLVVVLVVLSFGLGLLSTALDLLVVVGVSVVVDLLFNVYVTVAAAGTYGRITGELMGLVDEDGEPTVEDRFAEEDAASDGFGSDDDWGGDSGGDVVESPAAPSERAGQDYINRTSVQFIRRRFR